LGKIRYQQRVHSNTEWVRSDQLFSDVRLWDDNRAWSSNDSVERVVQAERIQTSIVPEETGLRSLEVNRELHRRACGMVGGPIFDR